LHQHVQDLSLAINGAPQVYVLAVDRDEDFIEMPTRISTRVRASELSGIGQAKLKRPAADRFIRDIDAALGIVTLSEIGPIWTIDRQAKPLKPHASQSAVVGKFQSIRLNVTTPLRGHHKLPNC